MKKLKSLIEARAAKQAEINTEEASLAQAMQELEEIGKRGNYENDLKRLGDAGARAQIIPRRLNVLYPELVDLEEAITPALRNWANVWNSLVAEKADYAFSQFIETALPFFGGRPKEKLTRLEFEYLHIPAVARIKAAFLDLGDYRRITGEARLALANRVVRHCESWWDAFGLKLPVDIPRAPRQASPKNHSPGPVRVRPRGENTIVLRGKVVKHGVLVGDKFLENGAEVEVTFQEYCALSRFFERLDCPDAAPAK